MTTSLLEAAVLTMGQKAFRCLGKDIYELIKKSTRKEVTLWKTEKKLDQLFSQMAAIRRVKTIWQVDKSIDLSEFYCDSHIIINNARSTSHELPVILKGPRDRNLYRKKVETIGDLGADRLVVIEGIAGQGKSILLRYLCATELALGKRIPIFVELRRIDKKNSLRKRVYASLADLKIPVDDQIFDVLASAGKLVLLLDAFDEIPEDQKKSVLTDIEDMASNWTELSIIVTSRPNQPIHRSIPFTITKLDDLRGQEYATVIRKLAAAEEWVDSLISHIEGKASHVKQLLCTPLMVTLLVVLYKSYQHLPSSLSGFYDDLFVNLMQRHDGTKPGFTRHRESALDDQQFREVFEALCFFSKAGNPQKFGKQDIYQFARKAIERCEYTANPEKYIRDIVEITCLLLCEGAEYRFIHKTVQEYYAASFIRSLPEKKAKTIYSKFDDDVHYRWMQELEFLSDIDSHRFKKYYKLPHMLKFLGVSRKELLANSKPSPELGAIFLKKIHVHRLPSDDAGFSCERLGIPEVGRAVRLLLDPRNGNVSEIASKVKELPSERTMKARGIPIGDLVNDMNCRQGLLTKASEIMDDFWDKTKRLCEDLDKRENESFSEVLF